MIPPSVQEQYSDDDSLQDAQAHLAWHFFISSLIKLVVFSVCMIVCAFIMWRKRRRALTINPETECKLVFQGI